MIRPVEMQMILPQSNQVGHQQHHVNQHASITSAQGTQATQKQAQLNADTVIHKENADEMQFRYDAKEKGNGSYSGEHQGKRKKKQHEMTEEEEQLRAKTMPRVNFDIKI